MYFSCHLKGTGKAKKDEHEVEYWINPQRRGNVREPTDKPTFNLLSPSKYFTVKS